MIYLRAGSYDLFLIGCLTSKSQLYVADRELFYFTFYFFFYGELMLLPSLNLTSPLSVSLPPSPTPPSKVLEINYPVWQV